VLAIEPRFHGLPIYKVVSLPTDLTIFSHYISVLCSEVQHNVQFDTKSRFKFHTFLTCFDKTGSSSGRTCKTPRRKFFTDIYCLKSAHLLQNLIVNYHTVKRYEKVLILPISIVVYFCADRGLRQYMILKLRFVTGPLKGNGFIVRVERLLICIFMFSPMMGQPGRNM
jgi:hypothetical protein